MSENKGKSNKVLVGVLCLLCVLILGLGVGIGILTNQPKKENTNSIYLDNGETVSMAAIGMYYDYVEKYDNDSDFVSDDAVKGFEDAIAETKNDNYKISLAIWCSNFINEYGGGADVAADYLRKYEDIAKDSNIDTLTLYSYYASMIAYSTESGDKDAVEYYQGMINQIAPSTEEYGEDYETEG